MKIQVPSLFLAIYNIPISRTFLSLSKWQMGRLGGPMPNGEGAVYCSVPQVYHFLHLIRSVVCVFYFWNNPLNLRANGVWKSARLLTQRRNFLFLFVTVSLWWAFHGIQEKCCLYSHRSPVSPVVSPGFFSILNNLVRLLYVLPSRGSTLVLKPDVYMEASNMLRAISKLDTLFVSVQRYPPLDAISTLVSGAVYSVRPPTFYNRVRSLVFYS